jgi:hypothetical protein
MAASDDPDHYRRNAIALKLIQPPELGPGEIKVKLGAPWVTAADLRAFLVQLLGGQVTVRHEPLTAIWEVKVAAWDAASSAATAEWGTSRIDAYQLVQLACNGGAPVVYDEVTRPDDSTTRVRNMSETMLAWRIAATPAALCGFAVGAGKAQPMDALVLTPSGFRRMGDLMVGDKVITADGTATEITGVFPQGPRDNYRVTFNDGATVECDAEHLWQVTTSDRKHRGYAPKALTLRELGENLRTRKGTPKWEVPIAGMADFDCGVRRLIEPYLLGLLLGDGNLTGRTLRFSSADPELVEAVRRLLPEGYACVRRGDAEHPYDYRIVKVGGASRGAHELIEWLYDLGLMGMTARYKFVPRAYKEAPARVRLAVLQGLMDTDGTVCQPGRVSTPASITLASRRLTEDVVWLARSLGGIANFRVRTVKGRPYYATTVTLPGHLNPFRLIRKADKYRPRIKYPIRRAITRVEPCGRKPMQCISVAHPSQLYVTSDFVVTHNTAAVYLSAVTLRRLGWPQSR